MIFVFYPKTAFYFFFQSVDFLLFLQLHHILFLLFNLNIYYIYFTVCLWIMTFLCEMVMPSHLISHVFLVRLEFLRNSLLFHTKGKNIYIL